MMPDLNSLSIKNVALSVADAPTEALPRFSGVYRFFGDNDTLLYIGKSVDIHSRVLSHFTEGRKPGRHQRMMSQVRRIDAQASAGEIGALLIENAAIKAETPLYNRRQRQVRTLWSIVLTRAKDGFLKPQPNSFSPLAERGHDSYGLFHNKRHIDTSLRRHARDHGLCLQALGLEQGKGPCFQFQLKRCDGACAGEETVEAHNARLLSVLDTERIAAWPFTGPLMLRERNITPLPGQPAIQYHVVNHWAYLGSVNTPKAAQKLLAGSALRRFDKEAYHLIRNAMIRGKVELCDLASGDVVDNPLLATTADSRR